MKVSGLTINWTADKLAEDATSQLAEQIDEKAWKDQENLTELSAEELAADMVYNTLIPEVISFKII